MEIRMFVALFSNFDMIEVLGAPTDARLSLAAATHVHVGQSDGAVEREQPRVVSHHAHDPSHV